MKRLAALLLVLAAPAAAQDLCSGFVSDKLAHARTASQSRPDVGVLYTDPDFGGKFRRITDIAPAGTGANPFIKPLYSPVAAWNSDESYLLLYQSSTGASASGSNGYRLYNGTTYAFIKNVGLQPSDVEQVSWDGSDPAVIYYPTAGARKFLAYNVDTDVKTTVHDFSTAPTSCGASEYLYTESHAGGSLDSDIWAFSCGNKRFVYRKSDDSILGMITWPTSYRGIASYSGRYVYLGNFSGGATTANIYDSRMNYLRSIDLAEQGHFAFSWNLSGVEYFDQAAFSPGPLGSGVGTLVQHNLGDGTSAVTIGESTGWPYPPSGTHISATAFQRPGWIWQSIIGGCPSTTYCPAGESPSYNGLNPPQIPNGQDILDNEIILTNTNTGATCRIVHHHATGKLNTHLTQPYWAEPHVVASPTGTRAVFASDWEDTNLVNTYVIELPSYVSGGNPIIRTSYLPNATAGSAYSKTLAAINGGAKTWSVVTGLDSSPCNGLSLSSAGVLSGTVASATSCVLTVRVTEATNSYVAERPYVLTVDAATGGAPTITTTELPAGTIGSPYSTELGKTGGTDPSTWDISAGTICAGLTLSSAGVISGTPTTAQTCNFTVRVTDSGAQTDTQDLSIVVSAALPALTLTVQPGGTSAVFRVSAKGLPSQLSCTVEVSVAAPESPVTDTLTGAAKVYTSTALAASANYQARAICSGFTDATTTFTTRAAAGGGTYTVKLKPTAGTLARMAALDAGLTTAKAAVYWKAPGEGSYTATNAVCSSGCTITLSSLASGVHAYYIGWESNSTAIASSVARPAYVAIP